MGECRECKRTDASSPQFLGDATAKRGSPSIAYQCNYSYDIALCKFAVADVTLSKGSRLAMLLSI